MASPQSLKVTFHQLEVFESVATRLSFTRAAEDLGLSQPTVSTQIKQLSEAIGLPLLEHIGKTLYLTQAGQELLATAIALRQEWASFETSVSTLKGRTRGSLRLACVTTAKYFAPELLGKFCEAYPDLEVKLEIANREKLLERFRLNLDDLYIMTLPPEELEAEAFPFLDNPLVVVASSQHPLATTARLELAQLQNDKFIMREPGSGTRETSEAFFKSRQFVPMVRMELGSNEAIKHAVAGGLGIAVLSQHVLDVDPAYDRLAVLDVTGFPLREKWYVLHPRGKRLSPIALSFRDFLAEVS